MADIIQDPRVKGVVYMCSAQVGKTELEISCIGYHVDLDPCPMLFVMPTESDAEDFSKERLAPLIRDTPVIRARIQSIKTRDGSNTLLHKSFPGGFVHLAGANSPSGLASKPIRLLYCDEVDKYPPSAGNEGDPVSLAMVRLTTFHNSKWVLSSTPNIKGLSRIEAAYFESDQRRFFVDCVHCQKPQWLKWAQVFWDKDKNGKHLHDTAHYVCEHCGGIIEEYDRINMVKGGQWVATAPFDDVAGFHISQLYSRWKTLAEIVKEFVTVTKSGDQERLKTWINSTLGETWEEKGESPEWERLYNQRESYSIDTIPDGLLLFAGVDVQADRFEIEVASFNEFKESWSVCYRVIHCNTSLEKSYEKLDEILQEKWVHEKSGAELSISMLAIDSGYNTQKVYNWVRKHPTSRVIAVKGKEELSRMVAPSSRVDVHSKGKVLRRGLVLWHVGNNIAKSDLYGALNLKKPTDTELEKSGYPSGYCHFPMYDEKFFQMICSEQLVTKMSRGRPKKVWQVKPNTRNEALDIRCYLRAGASVFGIDRFKQEKWEQIKEDVLIQKPVQAEPKKRRSSGYW